MFFFFKFSHIPSVSVLSSLCIQPFRANSPARERVYLVNARMRNCLKGMNGRVYEMLFTYVVLVEYLGWL